MRTASHGCDFCLGLRIGAEGADHPLVLDLAGRLSTSSAGAAAGDLNQPSS